MAPSSRRSFINKKLFCTQCNLEIEESDESIDCDKCNKTFHVVCTLLNKRQFNHLLANEKEEFVCHVCNNNNNIHNTSASITVELNAIKTELKKLDQLSSLHETMTFMSKQFDDILKGVAENKKKLEIVQKENKALKSEINSLKSSVKFLSDQRVQNDCVITGVKQNENVTAVDAVVKLSADVGVTVKPENISDAYFLKNKSNKSQSVVVKFCSQKPKAELMSMKRKLKEKEETQNIYINDYLSRETMNFLKYARSLKTVGYKAVYSRGAKIFAKRNETSKPRLLKCEDDVDKLLSEATTFQPPPRQSQVPHTDENSDNDYESPS
ncbi:uncharacterized protein LOC119614290 [Lucilia sericata]|uniref:uncharacterized protein LOC119614290 n=1 Tax=Lucilia sericata TaxID=13632 RepID=UPI0018A86541|nr:uncharacterized protein LOC119614290 [Lucilia sericata]